MTEPYPLGKSLYIAWRTVALAEAGDWQTEDLRRQQAEREWIDSNWQDDPLTKAGWQQVAQQQADAAPESQPSRISDAAVLEWARRHDLGLTLTELRCILDDARSLHLDR